MSLGDCAAAAKVSMGLRMVNFLQNNTEQVWERACSRWRFISHIHVEWTAVIASKLAPTVGISDP
ncbi:hypothetical protein PS647_04655 [Pseudomonas fluorescens]|nr:hypothetical protein PS647_04655 [Pseudomonas fluorescens]